LEAEWSKQYEAYRQAFPELAAELERRLAGRLADGWDDGLPTFAPLPADAQATRAASGKVLNAIAPRLPELVGGSADLATSTNLVFKNGATSRRKPGAPAASISACASTAWGRS